MAIKAVFFDLDGTLVDSNDLHVLAWAAAFARFGFRFDRETLHAQIGKGADNFVPSLLPNESEAVRKAIGDAHDEIFKAEYLARVKPFPQARDLMQRVSNAGGKVVLASSASQAEVDHYIDLLAVGELVSVTTSSDDVAKSKPAADIFSTALEKAAPLRADEVIVLGDTPYDMEAAGKAGIAAVAVRSGKFSDPLLQQAGAMALYDDVANLLARFTSSPLAG